MTDLGSQAQVVASAKPAPIMAIVLSIGLHAVVLASAVAWWLLHTPPRVPLDIDLVVVSEGNESDSTAPPTAPSSSDAPLTQNTAPPMPAAPLVEPTTPQSTASPLAPDVALPTPPTPSTPPTAPAVKPAPPKPTAPPQTASKPAPAVSPPNLALPSPGNGQSSAGVNGPVGGGDITELSAPPPVYPPAAQHRGEEGRVVVRVDIGTDGLARNATVETSSGFKELDQAAIESTKAWRFRNDSGSVVQATRGVSFVLHPNDKKR